MAYGSRRPARRMLSLPRRVMLFTMLFGLLLVGLDAWRSSHARQIEIAGDKIETANLARSLAQHIHDLVRAADALLVGTRQRVESAAFSPDRLAETDRLTQDRFGDLPALSGLFIIDATGRWLATPIADAERDLDEASRALIRHHGGTRDRTLRVGDPVRRASDGSWVIVLSRRFDLPDGTFGGVVLVTIAIAELQAYYGTFDPGPGGAISLVLSDGALLVRQPAASARVGTSVAGSNIFRDYLPRAPIGSYEYTATIDGVRRIGSYHQLDEYPFVMVVAHGLNEVLAPWRVDARLHLLITVAAAVLLAVIGHRFGRQVASRQEAEARYRLLAEHSSDVIVCVDMTMARLYVSPSITAMTGWTVAESFARPPGWFACDEDRPLLAAIGDRLRAGSPRETATYRYKCRDGPPVWVEARFRLVRDAAGNAVEIISNIRDISARKAAEHSLAAANRELSALAATDGLTGLANRRRLDEVSRQEWRRALREQRYLSLLMIDVDRFKAFNDQYGHQAGDRCLAAVARAAAGATRRPGDLAARYGGEEIAVLLSGTDLLGATHVGERVRAAVAALAVTHGGNQPFGVVTVSVGVASLRHDAEDPLEALIARADAALYDAKRGGRNRVVSEAEARPASEAGTVFPHPGEGVFG